MRMIFIIIILTLLSGCSILKPEVIKVTETRYIEKPMVHPPLPRPVNFHSGVPRVITKETIMGEPDRAVFQCFEWNDGQELGISLNDMRAYINSLRATVCSYRRELNESFCEEYIDNKDVE